MVSHHVHCCKLSGGECAVEFDGGCTVLKVCGFSVIWYGV